MITLAQYEALYMQCPTPQEGNIIKREWFRFYRELPQLDERIQSWDKSFKEAADSSYVVGQVCGRRGADKFLIDQVRACVDFPATLAAVRSLTAKHPRAHAKYVEDKANGPAVV